MSQYTNDEYVLHKLSGAAYKMTFEGEYEAAVETIELAARFWNRDDHDSWDEEYNEHDSGDSPRKIAARRAFEQSEDDTSDSDQRPEKTAPRENGSLVCDDCGREFESTNALNGHKSHCGENRLVSGGMQLPQKGTNRMEMVAAMINAHHDGIEWITSAELKDYLPNPSAIDGLNLLVRDYEVVQFRSTGNGKYEYRVDPDVRDEILEVIVR